MPLLCEIAHLMRGYQWFYALILYLLTLGIKDNHDTA